MASNKHLQMNESILGLTVWQGISQSVLPGILRLSLLAAYSAMVMNKLPEVPK